MQDLNKIGKPILIFSEIFLDMSDLKINFDKIDQGNKGDNKKNKNKNKVSVWKTVELGYTASTPENRVHLLKFLCHENSIGIKRSSCLKPFNKLKSFISALYLNKKG